MLSISSVMKCQTNQTNKSKKKESGLWIRKTSVIFHYLFLSNTFLTWNQRRRRRRGNPFCVLCCVNSFFYCFPWNNNFDPLLFVWKWSIVLLITPWSHQSLLSPFQFTLPFEKAYLFSSRFGWRTQRKQLLFDTQTHRHLVMTLCHIVTGNKNGSWVARSSYS